MERTRTKRSGVTEKAIDVIVVDDDHDCRLMLATALTAAECVVLAVEGADAAYEAAQRRVPDVIITDLQLRDGAAGWTLAQVLRSDPRTRDVGLVAVTGVVAPAMQIVAPFDAYLRKPVELGLIVQLVRQLAAVSRAARQRAHAANLR
jgi:CheY-like chemotaxis protein